jgi:mRNA-degrading endonuclease RelE of RelBE toxin-antitoxin system
MRIVGLITVVETPEFLAASSGLFDEDQRTLLVSYLAAHPLAGDLIAGTGGVRKLRWAVAGRGKRGGARVIYYVHNERLPLFLLTAYAKNVRADLSAKDRAGLKALVKRFPTTYERMKGQ